MTDLEEVFLVQLLKEQGQRKDLRSSLARAADAIYGGLHASQQALCDDEATLLSALCPRRAGKSHGALAKALRTGMRTPDGLIPLIGLTLKSVKRAYWDLLRRWDTQHGLGITFNFTNLEARLPNGTVIFLTGAETRAEIEKLRGPKYLCAILDECKSFSPSVLQELIEDVLEPALSDMSGWLLMIGTPGSILTGPFYDGTNLGITLPSGVASATKYGSGVEGLWSFHSWTLRENTRMPHLWTKALERKRLRGWADDNPKWMREYLGLWVPLEDALVFAYSRLKRQGHPVVFHADPNSRSPFGLSDQYKWHYGLGLDFGFEDDFGMVILAYNDNENIVRYPWSFKAPHLTVSQIASAIQKAEKLTGGFVAMVGDTGGLGKTVVETLNAEYGFNIIAADKREKYDHTELFNSDLIDGRVQIAARSDLEAEVEGAQWDLDKGGKEHMIRTGKLRIHASCPDHLIDAALYIFRWSLHRQSRAAEPDAAPAGTMEWYEAREKRELADVLAKHEARAQGYDESFAALGDSVLADGVNNNWLNEELSKWN